MMVPTQKGRLVAKRVPALPPTKAFLHVIYEYRYLALAASAWRRFGANGRISQRCAANTLLPGIAVLFQDSLLAHARGLIDFYTKKNPHDEDIVLADFPPASLQVALKKSLAAYKEPIEVHLLHITAWRDVPYRASAAQTPKGLPRQRVDWNTENDTIVDLLFEALDCVSRNATTGWKQPFHLLHSSALAILANPKTRWPKELGEDTDVSAYLSSLHL